MTAIALFLSFDSFATICLILRFVKTKLSAPTPFPAFAP